MNFGNEIPGGFKCLKQKYLLHQGELRMTTLEEVKCQPASVKSAEKAREAFLMLTRSYKVSGVGLQFDRHQFCLQMEKSLSKK